MHAGGVSCRAEIDLQERIAPTGRKAVQRVRFSIGDEGSAGTGFIKLSKITLEMI
jgi:hypothetical protein